MALLDLPLREFLDEVTAEGRSPGGGSVAALVTAIAPALWVTMPKTVASPSPVPRPGGFVVKNGSKTRVRTASSMPCPLSVTFSVT